MDIELNKKEIERVRAEQHRLPYHTRAHTMMWFVDKLEEAVAEVERLRSIDYKAGYDSLWDDMGELEVKYKSLQSQLEAVTEEREELKSAILNLNCNVSFSDGIKQVLKIKELVNEKD